MEKPTDDGTYSFVVMFLPLFDAVFNSSFVGSDPSKNLVCGGDCGESVEVVVKEKCVQNSFFSGPLSYFDIQHPIHNEQSLFLEGETIAFLRSINNAPFQLPIILDQHFFCFFDVF